MKKSKRKRHLYKPSGRHGAGNTLCGRGYPDFGGIPEGEKDNVCKLCINKTKRARRTPRIIRQHPKREPNEDRLKKYKRHLIQKQEGKCAACRRVFGDGGMSPQLDHIIPRSRGGHTDFENLQLLCRDCNLTKMAKDPVDWALEKGYYSAATSYAKMKLPPRQGALL